MLRGTLRALVVGAVLLGGAAAAFPGCGLTSERVSSETHFLRRCDADDECGSGLSCICGACTRSCTQDEACGELGVACLSNCEGSLSCGVSCSVDNDCDSHNSDLMCVASRCQGLADPEEDTAGGQGGASDSPQEPPCLPDDEALAMRWTGDASDEALGGILHGGLQAASPGQFGGAYNFDGIDDYIEYPVGTFPSLSDQPFSLVAWIRTSALNAIEHIVDTRVDDPGTFGMSLMTRDGNPGLLYGDGIGNPSCTMVPNSCVQTSSNRLVTDGTWHMVAVVVDASLDSARFYHDGEFAVERSLEGKQANVDTNVPALIGAQTVTKASGFFSGELDDLEIYTRALSDSEVLELHERTPTARCVQ